MWTLFYTSRKGRASLWNRQQRQIYILFVVDVSVHRATVRKWQTQLLDTWKVTQIQLLSQESAKSSQTPKFKHTGQSYPTLDALRHLTWPCPVDAHMKLRGPEEVLRQTVAFTLRTDWNFTTAPSPPPPQKKKKTQKNRDTNVLMSSAAMWGGRVGTFVSKGHVTSAGMKVEKTLEQLKIYGFCTEYISSEARRSRGGGGGGRVVVGGGVFWSSASGVPPPSPTITPCPLFLFLRRLLCQSVDEI